MALTPSVEAYSIAVYRQTGDNVVTIYDNSTNAVLSTVTGSDVYKVVSGLSAGQTIKITTSSNQNYIFNKICLYNDCSVVYYSNPYIYTISGADQTFYVHNTFLPITLVDSNPQASTVYLDGVWIGVTPFNYEFSFIHSHQLVFTKMSYADTTFNMVTPTYNILVTLDTNPTSSDVSIISTPSGANVYLPNGVLIGVTPFVYTMEYQSFTNIIYKLNGYQDLTVAAFYNSVSAHGALVPIATPTPTPTATPTPTVTPTDTPLPNIISNVIGYFLSDGLTFQLFWNQSQSGSVEISKDGVNGFGNHYTSGLKSRIFYEVAPYGNHTFCVNDICIQKMNQVSEFMFVENVTGYYLTDTSIFQLFWSQSTSASINISKDGVGGYGNHYVMGNNYRTFYNIPAGEHSFCVERVCIVKTAIITNTPTPTPTFTQGNNNNPLIPKSVLQSENNFDGMSLFLYITENILFLICLFAVLGVTVFIVYATESIKVGCFVMLIGAIGMFTIGVGSLSFMILSFICLVVCLLVDR